MRLQGGIKEGRQEDRHAWDLVLKKIERAMIDNKVGPAHLQQRRREPF
jgi:hypothetical protein